MNIGGRNIAIGLLRLAVIATVTTGSQAGAQELATSSKESARIELDSLRIEKSTKPSSDPGNSSGYLEINCWVPGFDVAKGGEFLVRFEMLDDVVDNTGASLLTKDRRARVRGLDSEAFYRSTIQGPTASGGAAFGPLLRLRLDPPSRRATSLRRLRGVVRIAQAPASVVKVDDFTSLANKKLVHAMLKDIDITPTLDGGCDATTVSLEISGKAARLLSWAVLTKDGELIEPESQRTETHREGVESQTFARRLPPECKLWILVAVPGEFTRVKFDLQDVNLP